MSTPNSGFFRRSLVLVFAIAQTQIFVFFFFVIDCQLYILNISWILIASFY